MRKQRRLANSARGGGRFGSGLAPTTEPNRLTPDEFEQHILEVAALWGRRMLQSRTIFLATDVLRSTVGDLNAYLRSIAKVFPIEPKPLTPSPRSRGEGSSHDDRMPDTGDASPHFDGVHIFLDNFVLGRHDRAAWNELAALGLTRVSIGIASGDPEIRAHYHQHWPNEALRSTFADIKSAGIGVSILTLVGAGGTEAAERARQTDGRFDHLARPGPRRFRLSLG